MPNRIHNIALLRLSTVCFIVHCVRGGCAPTTPKISGGVGHLSANYGPFSGGECRWLANIPPKKAVVLQTNNVKMYYKVFGFRVCTASLVIGSDEVDCKNEESFCYIYADDSSCGVTKSNCLRRQTQEKSILEINFNVPLNLYERQFRISYEYQNCSTDHESETTQSENEVTTSLITKPEKISYSTNSTNDQNTLASEAKGMSYETTVAIVVGCSTIIFLVLAALLATRISRNTKHGKSSHTYIIDPDSVDRTTPVGPALATFSSSHEIFRTTTFEGDRTTTFDGNRTTTFKGDNKNDARKEMKDNMIYGMATESIDKGGNKGDAGMELKDNIIYGMDAEATDKSGNEGDAGMELKDNIIYGMDTEATDEGSDEGDAGMELKDNIIYEMETEKN